MSGKGTAVDAAVGVAAGDGVGEGVGEGDAACACALKAKHRNSRIPASNAARSASVIILSLKFANSLWDCGIIGTIVLCFGDDVTPSR